MIRAFAMLSVVVVCHAGSLEWPQFGGPRGNFKSDATGLASSWPATGPKVIWKRALGDGYSAVSVDGNVIYTMYRVLNDEVVLAAEADTGKTIWEYRYEARFRPGMGMENGSGPHATPLVTEDGVYAIGIMGNLICLNKKTGKMVWSHNLYAEFNGTFQDRGFAPSPVAYRDLVIMKVGGEGHSFVAFDQKTGAVRWRTVQKFDNAPATPVLINVDGQDQLVAMMHDEVVAIDPSNARVLWTFPHKTDWGLNISTPVWGDDHLLFMSSAYSGGSAVIRLTRQGDRTVPSEVWSSHRMRVHFSTVVRVGDYVFGSSGDFGPAPLTAVDVKTGKIAWQDRTFSKASFVYADGKFVVVDEDGNLALADFTPQGLKVLSRVALLHSNAWTAPSVAGTRLYLRDRTSMMALDLR
ncbi:MAG TPA: PQQ-binding-like beta-propeller repeat protein [Bryobacteraceae bacterium]|nr:PQQ-binding-like beta-propeller repeat protein [Bryobacteraceae bacterium]